MSIHHAWCNVFGYCHLTPILADVSHQQSPVIQKEDRPILEDRCKSATEVECQVSVSIDEMQINFGTVVSKTMEYLETTVTPTQLADTLLALGAYEPVMMKEENLLEDYEDELYQAKTISDIY